jgi:hypothetical protein
MEDSVMEKERPIGKRELDRQKKAALRQQIAATVIQINLAQTASRVPDRVVNGDHFTAVNWKDAMERSGAIYHVKHEPSPRATVQQLIQIKVKLDAALHSII